jgi:hypothetical protein
MRRLALAGMLVGAITLAACAEGDSPGEPQTLVTGATEMSARNAKHSLPFEMDAALQAEIETRLTYVAYEKAGAIAVQREEAGVALPEGLNAVPAGFSWVGYVDGQTMGSQVFFLDRGNKQIGIQWVPGDPRRNGRNDVGYAFVDIIPELYTTDFVTSADVWPAIGRAMATWEAQACSPNLEIPLGSFFDWLDFDSDILHDGFYDLGPGVLGVTIPFVFVDASGPTDIDNDGNLDYAFAIIQYSSEFPWGIDTNTFPFIDVETVALHETGHGLGQAHFGSAFLTLANGRIHFAPRSVMNAAYSGLQQSLTGTDNAGHCSMYGSWPSE